MPSPIDIPEATLRATYAREQPHRLHWPQSFEVGMSDPAIAAIVRTLARHVPTYARRSAERARIGLGGGSIKGPVQPELTACESCGGTGWWTTYEGQLGEPPRRVSVPCPKGCAPSAPSPTPAPVTIDNKRRASGEKESDYE